MRIDSSGNLLFSNADTIIGTNTSDTADTGAIYLCGGGNQTVGRGANIRVHGNEDTLAGDVYIYSGNAAGSDILLSAYSSTSTIQFATNNTEVARIDSNGVLLINATAADGAGGAPGDINNAEIGKGYINLNRDDTATVRQIQFGKNGVVAGYIETGSSTTSYVTSSDARLKENIADADPRIVTGKQLPCRHD